VDKVRTNCNRKLSFINTPVSGEGVEVGAYMEAERGAIFHLLLLIGCCFASHLLVHMAVHIVLFLILKLVVLCGGVLVLLVL